MKSNKLIAIILLTALIVSTYCQANYAQGATNKGILVLVKIDESYYKYENLVFENSKGMLMLKANAISTVLGLEYSISNNTFTIAKNDNCANIYLNNSEKYKYRSSETKFSINKAGYKAYYAADKEENMIYYNTIDSLGYKVKYFPSKQIKEKNKNYSELGYTSVVVIDKGTKTPTLPKTSMIKFGFNFNSNYEIKLLTDYAKPDDYGNDLINYPGGFDDVYKLINKSNLLKNQPRISLDDGRLSFIRFGLKWYNVLSMSTEESCYYLSIRETHGLPSINSTVANERTEALQNMQVLKAYIYKVSSTPEELYSAILSHREENNDYGLNLDSFVNIGDSQVKVESNEKNELVTYIIKQKIN